LGTYFKGLLTENRERYLGQQETELEDMKEIATDKSNLHIERVKMAIKSLKSNTSRGVGGELIKSGPEKSYETNFLTLLKW
jgi:hypothetical protein